MSSSAGNPYANPVRNLSNKLKEISALEGRQAAGETLAPGKLEKVATRARLEKELAEAAAKAEQWEAANAPAAQATAAPKTKEKPKAADTAEAAAKKAPKAAPAKAAAAEPEDPQEIDDSANPYNRQIRNLRKKAKVIQELEAKLKDGTALNDAQKKKLQSKSQVQRELRGFEQQAKEWTASQLKLLAEATGAGQRAQRTATPAAPPAKKAAAEAEPKQPPTPAQPAPTTKKAATEPKSPPKLTHQEAPPKPAKEAKAAEAPKPEKMPAEPKPKKETPAETPQPAAPAATPKPAAPAATPKPAAAKDGLVDFAEEILEELKPYRNKVRNLQKKLGEIEVLRAKPLAELNPEQQSKLKSAGQLKRDLEHATELYLNKRLASS
eukprot:GGOE01061788.1.p1 GENE.GGOE01061788.1~~GGOE01061788.1.p1  ORF type:complete len:381 (-),score=128.92 GGOE01061788.1:313-1455(-)